MSAGGERTLSSWTQREDEDVWRREAEPDFGIAVFARELVEEDALAQPV